LKIKKSNKKDLALERMKESILSTKRSRNKSKKVVKKNYIDDGNSFEVSKIIYRFESGDEIVKEFTVQVTVGKNKIGKKTKLEDGRWVEIVNINLDEADLIFEVKEIC